MTKRVKNNWDYALIALELCNISFTRLGYNSSYVKLIVFMMTEISKILHNDEMEYERESARLYFYSEDFTKHCEATMLDETTVRLILTTER